jgi:hypothetical protein
MSWLKHYVLSFTFLPFYVPTPTTVALSTAINSDQRSIANNSERELPITNPTNRAQYITNCDWFCQILYYWCIVICIVERQVLQWELDGSGGLLGRQLRMSRS